MLKGVAKKDPLKLPSKADDGGDGENFYPERYDARRHASKRGRKRPETIYFLGFTLYCARNRKGNFRVGLRTEKSRLRRALMRLQDQMRRMRHSSIQEQTDGLNQMLRGHYAYYGIAGNIRALQRVHRAVERYWRKMLSSRSWQGKVWWKRFQQIKERFRCCDQSCISLTRSCKLSPRCETTSDERSAGNLHATFCGSRGAGDRPRPPGGDQQWSSLPRPQNPQSGADQMAQAD
jgi:hypothetical protein